MVSKALEKKRIKGRKNRVTIDDKYMGQEPWWDEDNPQSKEELVKPGRMNGWGNVFDLFLGQMGVVVREVALDVLNSHGLIRGKHVGFVFAPGFKPCIGRQWIEIVITVANR